jgi:hypothetical protein
MKQLTGTSGNHPRVFISYSHDSERHVEQVREFGTFLRQHMGIDAHMDAWYDGARRDWAQWAIKQLEEAEYVLAIASPKFRERADGEAPAGQGWGATFEGALLREKMTADRARWIEHILPVLLPGHSVDEIPKFLFPHMATHYRVRSITVEGLAELHRALTGTPRFELPPLGEYVAGPTGIREAPQRRQGALLTSLRPVAQGGDIRFTEADIDGRHHGDSIVYRPQLFASEPRGEIEFNLGRRYRTLETTVGVLDDATDAQQTGHFQVFRDGEQYTTVAATYGRPVELRVDVTGVLRLRLVAYRPGMTVSPLLAGARMAGGQSNHLPELAWGDPRLLS